MARIAWYVAFTATVFIVVGDVIVGAIFERGSVRPGRHGGGVAHAGGPVDGPARGHAPRGCCRTGCTRSTTPRTPARLGVLGVVLSAVIGVRVHVPARPARRRPRRASRAGATSSPSARCPTADPRQPRRPPPPGHRRPGHRRHHLATGSSTGCSATRLAWRIGRTKLAGRWLGPIASAARWPPAWPSSPRWRSRRCPTSSRLRSSSGPAGLAYVARRPGAWASPRPLATVDRVAGLARRVRR